MWSIGTFFKKKEKETSTFKGLDEYRKKLWSYKGKKWILRIAGILFLLALPVVYYTYQESLAYSDYDVLSVAEVTDVDGAAYLEYGEHLIRYTMDGISCLDRTGSLVWGQAYEIKNPIVDICGNYVAVAAQKGNNILVFNKNGNCGEIVTEYPIVQIQVAAQGVVAATMEDSGMNYIKMYSPDGTVLTTNKSSLEGNGYPFAIGLSEDGTKMAVSTLNIVNNQIETSLSFYNFSDVGQNYVEQLVGSFDNYGTSYVPQVEFINNDTVCAFADNQFVIYSMKQRPQEIVKVLYEDRVKSVFYDKNYIGIVFENYENEGLYKLCVYDTQGKCILEKILYQDYNKIYFVNEGIVWFNEYSCEMISISGRVKFENTFDRNIVLLKQVTATRYVWVSSSSISEIRLK